MTAPDAATLQPTTPPSQPAAAAAEATTPAPPPQQQYQAQQQSSPLPPPPPQPQQPYPYPYANGNGYGASAPGGAGMPPPPPQPQGQHPPGQQYYGQYARPAAAAPPPPGPNGLFNALGQRVSAMTGVGAVEGFDARELFSAVFQKRAEEDIEEFFLVGTHTTTPPLAAIKAIWPKPWVFYKTLLLSLAVFAGFLVMWSVFQNPRILPGLWIVGGFVIPLSVVIFYFEMNVPKNVSLYQVGKMLILGGVISLLAALIGFKVTGLADWLGAMSAGLIEETGKLIALLLIVNNRRYPWVLNGLLFGGAVGAGFAGFESAGYALTVLLGSNSGGAMIFNIFLRGLLSPGGHVAWTALVGAALWRVKGDQPFNVNMVFDHRFVRVLLFAMGLHMIWNSPLFPDGLFAVAKMLLLGAAAWAAILAFVQDGIKQVQRVQADAEANGPARLSSSAGDSGGHNGSNGSGGSSNGAGPASSEPVAALPAPVSVG